MSAIAAEIEELAGGIPEEERSGEPELTYEEEELALVRREQVRLIYHNAPFLFFAMLLGGAFLTFIYWDEAYSRLIGLWFTGLILFVLIRIRLWDRFENAGELFEPDNWLRLFVAGSFVTGAMWGALVFLLSFENQVLWNEFVVFTLLAGMTVATAVTASSYVPATLAFNVPALTPLALHFMNGGRPEMALSVVGYGILITLVGKSIQRWTVHSVRLGYRNERLLTAVSDSIRRAEGSEHRYRTVMANSPVGIIQLGPQGEPLYLNPKARDLLEIEGQAPGETLAFIDLKGTLALNPHLAARQGGSLKPHTYETWIRARRSGHDKYVAVTVLPLLAEEGRIEGYLATVSDVTERRRAQETLEHLAHHDSLTGVYNRHVFRSMLSVSVRQAQQASLTGAFLLLDLDRFKSVNETMGHQAGDMVLKAITGRLQKCLRQSEFVVHPDDGDGMAPYIARLGGDEFAVIIPDIRHVAHLSALAERIIKSLEEPFDIEGKEIVCSASLGICVYPRDGEHVDKLIRHAEAALHRAKREGGGYQLFNEEIQAQVRQKHELEKDFRNGLKRREFELHYQPQIDLRSGETVGMEALMRWNHPEQGVIPPDVFIPVAEETRFIIPLSEWLFQEACIAAAGWNKADLGPLRIAVNVSPQHVKNQGFADTVVGSLKSTGLPAARLELEITERFVLDSHPTSQDTLHRMNELGVNLAIDDFGTGYSSLEYLKRYTFSKLKIDRCFVSEMVEDADSAAIVKAVIGLGHSLGLRVIAEGVETAEHVRALRELGCDEAQGYYYAKPMPKAECEVWLRENTRRRAKTA